MPCWPISPRPRRRWLRERLLKRSRISRSLYGWIPACATLSQTERCPAQQPFDARFHREAARLYVIARQRLRGREHRRKAAIDVLTQAQPVIGVVRGEDRLHIGARRTIETTRLE